MSQKILLSGIQPSGDISLGQYLGVLKDWVNYQSQYDCFFMCADLHALTTQPLPSDLYQRRYDTIAFYLAIGLNPQQSHLYFQSHVQSHAQLCWLLSSQTFMGQLARMTQFKDKSQKQEQGIAVGLFTYPIMMAADILLYQADYVPVGDDQKQHLELARDLVDRINFQYNLQLTKPSPLMPKIAGRIKALQDPSKKMSKSDENNNNGIFFSDSEAVIRKKIMRAVTDSDAHFSYHRQEKVGLSNLIDIYVCLSGMSVEQVVKQYSGGGYGDFKKALAQLVVAEVMPIQEKWQMWRHKTKEIDDMLADSHQRVVRLAESNLHVIQKQLGLSHESPC